MPKISQTILFEDFDESNEQLFCNSDIIILKTSYKKPFEKKKWDSLMNILSVDLQNEVEKYIRWEDQYNTLIGKLLVFSAYKIIKNQELKFEYYKRDENNKPFIQDSALNFNISHSGKTILCAISKHNIQLGIDVEEIKSIDIKGFNTIFHQNEFNRIIQANSIDSFYKYWTRKEAYTKAIGVGITIPLDKIDTTKNMISVSENNKYYLKSYKMNKYYCSLAYTKEGSKVNWIEVKF
ncbi:MAG: 4'-phosphopantetheinyl transferase superfamily protein [Flavobacteriaceae bacterium]|nr:4'-phosphopantetheinyl transferase superfamily protein [Flavobacteriaceae bacterium]